MNFADSKWPKESIQMVQMCKWCKEAKKPNGAECKSHAWCFVNVSCQERFNQSTLQKIFFAFGANTFEIYSSGTIGTFGVPTCYTALQLLSIDSKI